MLDPKKNRVDYCQEMMPPDGYEFDCAIGTTYSLDFETLICVLSSLGNIDFEEINNNLVKTLNVLKRIGSKVRIFCENGQIKVPDKISSALLLYDQIVYTVKMENNNSFHPKFWLVRYKKNKTEFLYRLLLLSRNLTFDRSWDVIFSIDGSKHLKGNLKKNNPIICFLKFLQIHSGHCDFLSEMVEDLNFVEFKLENNHFEDIDFIPLGIFQKTDIKKSVIPLKPLREKGRCKELAIISPFLSKECFERLPKSKSSFLLTRKETLQKICNSQHSDINFYNLLKEYEIYVLKDQIIDGESQISDGIINANKQELHAKIFFVSEGGESYLYLGSANATSKAFNGNVEFLIRLKIKNSHHFSLKKLKELFGLIDSNNKLNATCLLEQINIEELRFIESQESKSDNRIIKKCLQKIRGSVEKLTSDLYAINLEVSDSAFPDLEICPLFLTTLKYKDVTKKISFAQLTTLELSKFFIIRFKDLSFSKVVEIQLEDMPQDDKIELIMQDIISDKNKIFQYIELCCYNGHTSFWGNYSQQTDEKEKQKSFYYAGLYEEVLKTAAFHPERINELKELTKLSCLDNDECKDIKSILAAINDL